MNSCLNHFGGPERILCSRPYVVRDVVEEIGDGMFGFWDHACSLLNNVQRLPAKIVYWKN